VTSSMQRKESSVQTAISFTNQKANSYKKNKSSIDFRIAEKTE
jgi:hypothetical protein